MLGLVAYGSDSGEEAEQEQEQEQVQSPQREEPVVAPLMKVGKVRWPG